MEFSRGFGADEDGVRKNPRPPQIPGSKTASPVFPQLNGRPLACAVPQRAEIGPVWFCYVFPVKEGANRLRAGGRVPQDGAVMK